MNIRTLLLVAAAPALGLIACGGDNDSTPQAAPSPAATALPAETQIECVNVERAYNAWNGFFLPQTSDQVLALNEITASSLVDDGDDFLAASRGYADQPSKALAVAIAEYNFQLALAAVEIELGGMTDTGVEELLDAITAVQDAYEGFAVTCR